MPIFLFKRRTPAEKIDAKPKSWFRRCLGWVVKGTVIVVLLLVVYIPFEYLYDDWRGARNWAEAKADLEAGRISLDPKTYIPVPVPDADNFAALPIFQPDPDPAHNGVPDYLALNKALAPVYENIYYPSFQTYKPGKLMYLGDWARGDKPDMALVQKQLVDYCRHASPPIQVPADATPSEILGLICPVLGDLRAANLTRPACRFNLDYSSPLPENAERNINHIQSQLRLARALAYEEELALLDGQPQIAFEDFKVDWKISAGLAKEPFLVNGLVSVGVVAIHQNIVNEGLALHAWNDQQLTELDADLGKMDFLAESQLCLRGALAVESIPLVARYETDRSSVWKELRDMTNNEYKTRVPEGTLRKLLWLVWIETWLTPSGWQDEYLADFAPVILPGKAQMIDIASRRVFPEKGPKESADQERGKFYDNPPISISWSHAVKQFALAQVLNDEARIGCRLERYRLANGAYPGSLDALAVEYGELPHDIMNGEPYHYKLHGDGTYVLYSVGWNQKDDGGTAEGGDSTASLDWIWTNYPNMKKPK